MVVHQQHRRAYHSTFACSVQGEPVESFPFLGSSRLAEPPLRHGWMRRCTAPRGTPEGRTMNGVPVYNLAKPLLQCTRPDTRPFFLYELPRESAEAAPAAT